MIANRNNETDAIVEASNRESFSINGGKGFKLVFPNGLILSTQFGPANYGSNYVESVLDYAINPPTWCTADTVEIAIFSSNPNDRKWFTKKILGEEIGDDVKGYVDINEWLEIVDKVKNYKKEGGNATLSTDGAKESEE